MAGPFLFFFYRPILYIGFEVRNFLCLSASTGISFALCFLFFFLAGWIWAGLFFIDPFFLAWLFIYIVWEFAETQIWWKINCQTQRKGCQTAKRRKQKRDKRKRRKQRRFWILAPSKHSHVEAERRHQKRPFRHEAAELVISFIMRANIFPIPIFFWKSSLHPFWKILSIEIIWPMHLFSISCHLPPFFKRASLVRAGGSRTRNDFRLQIHLYIPTHLLLRTLGFKFEIQIWHVKDIEGEARYGQKQGFGTR